MATGTEEVSDRLVKDKFVAIRMDEELIADLKQLARRKKWTQSLVIREALTQYIRRAKG